MSNIKPVSIEDFDAALDRALYDAMTSGNADKDILSIAERRAKAKRVGVGGSRGEDEAMTELEEAARRARGAGGDFPPAVSEDEDDRS